MAIRTLRMDEDPVLRKPCRPIAPVSYTHLDVYKRQLQGLAQDGMIEENSRATAVTLYWRVDE